MSGSKKEHAEGILFALAAYGWWGLVPPLYFTALHHIPAEETLAHRIIWSVPLLAALVHLWRRWPEFRRCLSSKHIVAALLLSTTLIAVNWYVYIYGVANKEVVQTSLGYFINPLVNVVLGLLVFRERLRGLQWLAVALAAAGVAWLTIRFGQPPWIALTLAVSFGLYGLVRKIIPADSLVSLSVETLLLVPIALGYLIWLNLAEGGNFAALGWQTDVLLLFSGVVTVVPLLCFGQAARKLPLTMLGFVQYLSPTLQFLTAVLILREEMKMDRLAGFCFIWLGLAVYSADSLRQVRQRRRIPEESLLPVEEPDPLKTCPAAPNQESTQHP